MIQMKEKQEIVLNYFRDGKSKSAIAKELSLNWKTVDRYIKKYNDAIISTTQTASEFPRLLTGRERHI